MNKTTIILIGIVATLLVSGVFLVQKRGGVQSPSGQETTSNLGKAPDFNLKDYSGNTVKLADFQGKPLIINSWAAWCPFCRKELVDFAIVQKEFSANGGSASGGGDVVIIAINRQESLATAKGYTDKQGTSEGLVFLLDPTDSFYQSIGGFSMPETIFVDKGGIIRDHKRGPMEVDEIRERINKLLEIRN